MHFICNDPSQRNAIHSDDLYDLFPRHCLTGCQEQGRKLLPLSLFLRLSCIDQIVDYLLAMLDLRCPAVPHSVIANIQGWAAVTTSSLLMVAIKGL